VRPTVDIDPDQLVAAVMSGDPAALGDAPIATIVSGLRHAFIGNQLGCGDFATIELRLLLWHAGQMDKLELIRNGADPYRDFAAGLFRIGDREAYLATPKDAMTFEQKHHRQVGKPFVLGAGYGMGVDRFHGQEPDVPFELIKPGIDHYRRLWAPKVPQLWDEFDWAVRTAIRSPGKVVETSCGVRFEMQAGRLAVRLISGKEIFFPGGHIDGPDWWFYVNEDGRWQRRKGYGGLVTAGVVSATAREILADAMLVPKLEDSLLSCIATTKS